MIIGKTHEKYQFIKELLKTNIHKDYTYTDDLQVLENAIKFNLVIDTLIYSYEEVYKDETIKLLTTLKKKALNVFEASNKTIDSLLTKENHAKILAGIKFTKYDIDYFNNLNFIFVLDHLEIPGNIGTIYRTLDAAKCDGVILVDEITRLSNNKVTSSSRGTNLIIPSISLNYSDTLNLLTKNNYRIMLAEPILGKDYQSIGYEDKVAIIVGNERFGINNDWYNHNCEKLFIPMEGNNNSLNVGVAASIIAYQVYMEKYYKKK